MTPGKKQAFEPTGLIPRSIVRTFERFYKQLLPRTKYSAIREYRISRYQVLVSLRCLCTLLILPLVTRIIANWLIFPQVQYFWDVTCLGQDSHVFSEIDQFSQVIFFDSLLDGASLKNNQVIATLNRSSLNPLLEPSFAEGNYPTVTSLTFPASQEVRPKEAAIVYAPKSKARTELGQVAFSPNFVQTAQIKKSEQQGFSSFALRNVEDRPRVIENKTLSTFDTFDRDQALQEKIFELAQSSHFQALQSLTNVFADFLSIVVLIFLLITLRPEITILKSFLVEVIYNLSDTTKSFLLILMTDLLVGFHSPRGWETMFSLILHHFGLPENQDFVFLFVATLPVILDTVFKYWIFRHLNKISPSTVATYHNMIE